MRDQCGDAVRHMSCAVARGAARAQRSGREVASSAPAAQVAEASLSALPTRRSICPPLRLPASPLLLSVLSVISA
jgi:hypothetical protein